MTVTTELRVVRHIGNGSTTVFPYAFEIPTAGDAVVIVETIATGARVTIGSGSYSIAGLGVPAGGSVTYPLAGSPLSSAYALIIAREVDYTQDLDITNQDGFHPEVVEDQLDDIVFQVQQLAEGFQRTIRAPVGDAAATLELPTAAARASKGLGFDASGNATVLTNTVVTSAAFYGTKADVEGASTDADWVRTVGYAVVGDGGGALYKKVGAEPSHALKIQSLSGTWYEYVLEGGRVDVRQAGAVGDYDVVTLLGTDDTTAFQDVAAYCRTVNVQGNTAVMFISPGNYKLTGGIAQGIAISVEGVTPEVSRLYPTYASATNFLDFTSFKARMRIGNFHFEGPSASSANEVFLVGTNAALLTVHDITLKRCTGLDLDDAFGTYIERFRTFEVDDPIRLTRPNGSTVRDVYNINYTGEGVRITEGLSTKLQQIICEHGDGTSVAVRLQATQNLRLDGLYTEGTMQKDVYLSAKNSRACVNTVLSGLWLNSAATEMIHAQAYKGLLVEDVVMQTPVASHLIDLTGVTVSTDPIYFRNIVQVDQNHNSFTQDVYDSATQTKIPVCEDNRKVRMLHGNPAVGDGTSSDDTNIANHTTQDTNGYLPVLDRGARVGIDAVATDLDATSSSSVSTYGSESAGIKIYATDYGMVSLHITGTVTSSLGNAPSFFIRLTNSTMSDNIASTGDNLAASGDPIDKVYYVNVQPGSNDITLAITREQGASGTNTINVTDFEVT